MSAGEILKITGGELLFGSPLQKVVGICSDSRQVREGELFIPLLGRNFDGHDFIALAMAKGAAGSLVQRGREQSAAGNNQQEKFAIAVGNVLKALGDLAHAWRSRHPVKVVAITGSNGKTTTKEMTAGILSRNFKVLKTEGNLNNLIGLPLMLLRLTPEHEVAVLEMGMSEPGEIRRLTEIAEPQVSTIINIGRAHLEFLGSLEGVARAKGELWERVREEDWIAVNVDDPRVVKLAAPAQCRKKTFGILSEADIRAEDLRFEEGKGANFSLRMDGKKRTVRLAAFGRHNVYNALAAAALAGTLGMGLKEIGAGLEVFQPFSGRGKILGLGQNVRVLDDSYNANPESLRAILQAFAEMKGQDRGLLVMGDMLELGPASPAEHEKAGREIGKMGFAHIFFMGEKAPHLAKGALTSGMEEKKVHTAASHEEVLRSLEKIIEKGDWVLVKGSRAMQMERVIRGLENFLGRA